MPVIHMPVSTSASNTKENVMRVRQIAGLNLLGLAVAGVALLGTFTPAVGAQGKSAADIYLDKCAVCHGADGAGKTAKGKKLKVQDVRETEKKFTAAQMAEIVTKGKGDDMDAFGKELTPAQIAAIVDYYRGLAKK
jgi:mono/diheme cytochrome c family protein